MPTMAEHESKMTIYYYKSDGEIYSCCTGINDMSTFGNRRIDYELILDYLVADRDYTVLEFMGRFYVDADTKVIKLKSDYVDFSKYL